MPKEESVSIPGPGVILEGRFLPGKKAHGVVITHPHPLYGGSMDNNVVRAAAGAFQARGFATLRLNFRGVGGSTGRYGEGLGEVEDVAPAVKFLAGRSPGSRYLAGYSFGAAVVARALLRGLEVQGAFLIAPPIAFMDLAFLPEVPRLKLVVVGDRDEFCPLADLRALLAKRDYLPPVQIIRSADHFFGGREKELFRLLKDWPLEDDGSSPAPA